MIRIGVAQVPQTADIKKNLTTALDAMVKASNQGVELLCFPETHLSGYRIGVTQPDAPCDEDTLRCAEETVREKCIDLSLGIIIGTETPSPFGKPFNSVLVIDEFGNTLARHHKSRLTPKETHVYERGKESKHFTFKGIPMGVIICFEGFRFPEITRTLAYSGAQVVFLPQFNCVSKKMLWKQPILEALIMARAGENTIYFISANMCHPLNNCRSLIISPNGLIQDASILGQEMLLVADLDPRLATQAFLKEDPSAMAKALGEEYP